MLEVRIQKLISGLNDVVNDGETVIGSIEKRVVIIKPIPKEEQKTYSKKTGGVSCFDLRWRDDSLVRNPDGDLIARIVNTDEGCKLMYVGLPGNDPRFQAEYTIELRTHAEHDAITESIALGKKLLDMMTEFYKSHPEHVQKERHITHQNPERLQLITFHERYASVWIPRKGVNDGNWLGLIHLELDSQNFTYELYDGYMDEHHSVSDDIWTELDTEKTVFFVQSLIDNPVLPRNAGGILY